MWYIASLGILCETNMRLFSTGLDEDHTILIEMWDELMIDLCKHISKTVSNCIPHKPHIGLKAWQAVTDGVYP